MLISLCYLIARRVLQLAVLRVRSDTFKELEIVVLHHELAVLRRRMGSPPLTAVDRVFLAAAVATMASTACTDGSASASSLTI